MHKVGAKIRNNGPGGKDVYEVMRVLEGNAQKETQEHLEARKRKRDKVLRLREQLS